MDRRHRIHVRGAVRAVAATIVFLTVCVGLATLSASPASAACEINPAQSGAATSAQTSIFGASAKITYQNPVVCNQAGRSSSAWAMVSAPNDGQPNGPHNWYFQVGFKKRAGLIPVKWAQWTKSCYPNCGPNPVHQNWYGSATSSTNTYAVFLVASIQRLRATIDGVIIDSPGPTYNPANYWDANWRANYSGETQDRDSNIPGVTSDKVQFNNIMRYNSDGSITFVTTFAASGVQCAGSCPQYHYNAYSPPSGGLGFRIWTG